MTITRRHVLTILSGALAGSVWTGTARAAQSGKKEFAFKGKVEGVDLKAKTVRVTNENVPGWMMAMTMTYGVDKEAVLKQVKAGDQIAATVYQDNFKTLYNVTVVPPEKKK